MPSFSSIIGIATSSGGVSLSVAQTWLAEQTYNAVLAFARAIRSVSLDVGTTTHTLALTQAPAIRMTNAAARTVTLPASGAVGTADVGLEWRIHDAARTADTAPVTIQAPAGVTLNGVAAGSAQIVANGGAAIVRVVAANTWETVGL